jgi:hypothetical protein
MARELVDGKGARCAVCGHPLSRHTSGGMCAGEPPDESECYCVLFPDSPDAVGHSSTAKGAC